MSVLDEILERKRHEIAEAKRRLPPAELERRATDAATRRGFRRALENAAAPAVIAEIKRRSPSRGEIRADFDPEACAGAYLEGGAAALSVLTDEHYFGGHLSFLDSVRQVVPMPILRKDFTVDPYQIDEARAFGADAVLLIVAALTPDELARLHRHAEERDLDALVEVHDEAELEVAAGLGARLIGVNNRDLRTFETHLSVTERLAPRVPSDALLVAESGIHTHDDVERLRSAGARAFLVGESLMREADPGAALRKLRGAA
jgi:indole-3-glycerol phosphate synthase